MSKPKDPFAQAPEFLAAFDNIVANGFLQTLNLEIDVVPKNDDAISHCKISATGYVPNDPKYMQEGCSSIIDARSLIDSCRKFMEARTFKIGDIAKTKIETENWPIFDDKGEDEIGSQGTLTRMSIDIWF